MPIRAAGAIALPTNDGPAIPVGLPFGHGAATPGPANRLAVSVADSGVLSLAAASTFNSFRLPLPRQGTPPQSPLQRIVAPETTSAIRPRLSMVAGNAPD